jgi:hypothetical protein
LQVCHKVVWHVDVKASEYFNVSNIVYHRAHLSFIIQYVPHHRLLTLSSPLYCKRHLPTYFHQYLLLLSILGSLLNDHGLEVLHLILGYADEEVLEEYVVADAAPEHSLLCVVQILEEFRYILDNSQKPLVTQ